MYLDAHILEICITVEDLLPSGHPHMVFTDRSSVHQLLSHIFMLDLDVLHYPSLHDLNMVEHLLTMFYVHNKQEIEDKVTYNC